MNINRDARQQRRQKLSRRGLLMAAGAGSLSLLAGSSLAAEELPPPRFLLEWGRKGAGNGEFSACVGVTIGPDDEIYTSEFRNQRVQRFTLEGRFIGMFPIQPFCGGLAVDSAGIVYVGVWNSNKMAAYSRTGELLREWGRKGTGDDEFQLPGAVSLGPDDLLYVPDQGNSRVVVFTREGRFVRKWGEYGTEPGQFGGGAGVGSRFAGPQMVAFDRAGNVYTTDAALDRVQKFTAEGKLLGYWGNESAEPGGFGPPPLGKDGKPITGGPIGICVDRKDRVWVGGTNHRVQQFTNDGKYLRGLGPEGTEPGRFHTPHALTLDRHGCLYVADTMNARIQKFATD
jgi:tripartite motif-containing protein 71